MNEAEEIITDTKKASGVGMEITELQNECDELASEMIRIAKDLVVIEDEKTELADKNIRLLAEMENIKRRSNIDVANAHKYALDKFAKELLEVADSLDMGIKATSDKDAPIESINEGIHMTQKVFLETLKRHGIEATGEIGDKFDPEKHEAISMQPADKKAKNTILELAQTGWNLNGRLLRPAMVIIGS